MPKLALNIQYDGTNYCGWQFQKKQISIQQRLEDKLFSIAKKHYRIIGAGRTDSGVHARGQVAHTTIDDDFKVPHDKIFISLNQSMPKDILINKAMILDDDFHSRFSATFREYSYTLTTKRTVFERRYRGFCRFPLDKYKLFDSAEIFQTNTDFTTFSKMNPDIINPVCNVEICEWTEIEDGCYKLRIKANHFLYGMVRSLVGAMTDIARNKLTKETVREFLYAKNRDFVTSLAPASGLILEKIYYPEPYSIISE